ncbi:MAG: hypothetical protein HY544_00635 [Candidatus Diapherotrites archaeon]|uniref:Uncharacterized protein n=1 Tax=Candidatus Iainarchaeum sp. TaxID=3101447 RepID=A0A8T3YP81_9ARCH|nr:hypothetical protein [Candidatus Diapherotrites archaeon]
MADGRMLLLLAIVLVSVILLSPSALAGKHCWYNETISQTSISVNFTGKHLALQGRVVDGAQRETYLVKTGESMNLADISTFVANCVDGARSNFINAVRLMEVMPDGSRIETGINNKLTYDGAACEGGNNIKGSAKETNAFKFGVSRAYTFEAQYASSLSSLDPKWKPIKKFDVIVAPGNIDVNIVAVPTVGVRSSVYASDAQAESEAMWKISNVGEVDVNVQGISAVRCEGLISGCGFLLPTEDKPIAFPHRILPGQSLYFREKFTAKKPGISPSKGLLAVDVLYSDPYGFETVTYTTKQVPIEHEVSFSVASSMVYPYRTQKKPFELDGGTTYYVQTCTDSPQYELNGPGGNLLFGASIYDEQGAPVTLTNVFDNSTRFGNTNFHQVSNCAPQPGSASYQAQVAELKHMNEGSSDPNSLQFQGAGMGKFTTPNFAGKRTYSYVIEGLVGLKGHYKSDFMHIADKFDNGTQLLVDENIFVRDSLGAGVGQEIKFSAPTSKVSAKLTAFEGTKSLGQYKPSIELSELGSYPVYLLTNSSIDGKGQQAGHAYSFSDSDTAIFIDPQYGDVYARTSSVGTQNMAPPSTDVNIAWLGTEKYMFYVNAGPVGLCRDMQGNAFQDATGKAMAVAGNAASPHVKYDWAPSRILPNECDNGNINYTVCDSAQFAMELLRKLNIINELNKAGNYQGSVQASGRFQAYLMKDGFSTDFQGDLDAYLKNRFFSSDLGYASGTSPWAKYFSDTARLTFSSGDDRANTPEAQKAGRGVHEAGLYNVDILIEYDKSSPFKFFDESGNPLAKINVSIGKAGSLPPNLLYSLPIDAELGLLANAGGMERQGYGVGFTGTPIPVSRSGNAQDYVMSQKITDGSTPVAFLDVSFVNNMADATKTSAAQMLLITPDSSGQGVPKYKLKFSGGYPVPLIIKAEPSGSSLSASYSVSENKQAINAGAYLARLSEISYYATGVAENCTDTQTKAKLPLVIGTDRQASAYSSEPSCRLGNSSPDTYKVYGFNRDITNMPDKGANAYFGTVLYPVHSTEATITNACASQGRLYVATLSNDGSVSGYKELAPGSSTHEFDRPQAGPQTLADAIAGISSGSTCIAYGTMTAGASILPDNVGIWWNEGRFAKQLRDKLAGQPAGLPVNACFREA